MPRSPARHSGSAYGRLVLGLALLIGSLLAALPRHVAAATTFTVSQQSDYPDDNPGDASIGDGGDQCIRRAAIMESNVLPGSESMILPAGATSWA